MLRPVFICRSRSVGEIGDIGGIYISVGGGIYISVGDFGGIYISVGDFGGIYILVGDIGGIGGSTAPAKATVISQC